LPEITPEKVLSFGQTSVGVTLMSYFQSQIFGGRQVVAAIAALAVFSPAAVQAQDAFDWEGWFGGATLGGAMYGVEASDLTDTFTNDASKVETLVASYGISVNYNWSPYDDNLIIGGELDATFGLKNEEVVAFNAPGTDGLEFINSWDSVISLRGRAGMTSGKMHAFVAGGPAFANANYTFKDLDPGFTECTTLTCVEVSETLTGVSIGAGMEYAFRDDWVGKFEFMHYEMPTVRGPILDGGVPSCGAAQGDECTVSFDSSSTLFRFGITRKF
jgi:outer membrane immunogenic protein